MTHITIPRHVLMQVEKPARYTGGEWGSIHKAPPADGALTRFAFCFPDIYEIGMSNVALRILYDLVNKREDAWCERVFSPWTDMEQKMRGLGLPLFSIESKTPLNEFDLVGFTLQYELCYTNVLNMLDLGSIPLKSADRREGDPIVLAGGPVVFNIEPMADFFDLVIIGEGEEVTGELLDLYAHNRDLAKRDRVKFLELASRIDGVYVPAFYDVAYKDDGTVESIRPNRPGVPKTIRKRVVMDLDQASFPTEGLVPNTEIVHDRMFLEVLRGCPRGCRFCQAGMIYRPVREKSAEVLVSQAKAMEAGTGYDELGLLSLSTSDYGDLENLTNNLLCALEPNHTSLSLPSLRLDSFSLDLMRKVSRTRKSGLTFAPEAGTQRLRDVINKNVTEQDLLTAMELAFKGGWNGAKLYFMLGLPTETDADVDGIADLVRKIERLYNELPKDQRPRKLELVISTALFIPKPFTPFQWSPQATREALLARVDRLRNQLKSRRIKYQWHDADSSYLEAIFARGDRRLGSVILEAFRQGSTFDAWDDHFDLPRWLEQMTEAGLDPAFYASRERAEDEVFPWDHMDVGVQKDYLRREYNKALADETTPQCHEYCGACGAQVYKGGICVDRKPNA